MTKINKKNIKKFLLDFNYLDGYKYNNIKYDVIKNKVSIIFSNPKIEGKNIKLEFKDIKECNIKEVFDWEELSKIFLDYVKLEEMELMCFATSLKNPNIYIVCDEIKYDIMK